MQQPHPISFTFTGQYLNGLIDKGIFVEISQIEERIKNHELFEWLKSKYGSGIFLVNIPKEDLHKVETFFAHLINSTISENDFGVSKNGLCVLVSYCFEACQQKKENINYIE